MLLAVAPGHRASPVTQSPELCDFREGPRVGLSRNGQLAHAKRRRVSGSLGGNPMGGGRFWALPREGHWSSMFFPCLTPGQSFHFSGAVSLSVKME